MSTDPNRSGRPHARVGANLGNAAAIPIIPGRSGCPLGVPMTAGPFFEILADAAPPHGMPNRPCVQVRR